MAYTLSRNLKLRIDSNLTANAKFNLEKIDSLAGVYYISATENVYVRSKEDVIIKPQDSSLGGLGTGGTVSLGEAGQPLASLAINASAITLSTPLAYAQLNLTGSIVNADISNSAAISYSKLSLSASIVNADISPTAAIAGTKVSPDFGSQDIETTGELRLGDGTYVTGLKAPVGLAGDVIYTLPVLDGSNGQVLSTDGNGNLSWDTVSGGGGSGGQAFAVWLAADGATKTVTHGLGTRKVMVEVVDTGNDYETVQGLRITRPTASTVVLESSSAPGISWTVMLRSVE